MPKQVDETCFFVKDNDYFKRVNFKQILLFEAAGSYSLIYTSTNKYCVSFNLSEISNNLPQELFIRTHRSYIVNLLQIDSFIGNEIHIKNHKVPISKNYKSEFLNRLIIFGKVRL